MMGLISEVRSGLLLDVHCSEGDAREYESLTEGSQVPTPFARVWVKAEPENLGQIKLTPRTADFFREMMGDHAIPLFEEAGNGLGDPIDRAWDKVQIDHTLNEPQYVISEKKVSKRPISKRPISKRPISKNDKLQNEVLQNQDADSLTSSEKTRYEQLKNEVGQNALRSRDAYHQTYYRTVVDYERILGSRVMDTLQALPPQSRVLDSGAGIGLFCLQVVQRFADKNLSVKAVNAQDFWLRMVELKTAIDAILDAVDTASRFASSATQALFDNSGDLYKEQALILSAFIQKLPVKAIQNIAREVVGARVTELNLCAQKGYAILTLNELANQNIHADVQSGADFLRNVSELLGEIQEVQVSCLRSGFVYETAFVHDVLRQDVKEGLQYDVIVDCVGAYTYSPKRLSLLTLMYVALGESGRAFIRCREETGQGHNAPRDFVVLADGQRQGLTEYLCAQYPRVFSHYAVGDCTCLQISKDPRYPGALPDLGLRFDASEQVEYNQIDPKSGRHSGFSFQHHFLYHLV